MLQLENYRVYKSDVHNYRIEEFKPVINPKTKISTDKWVLLPNYYNNLSHALKVILNDNLAGDILESEAVKIGELLEKINTTYDRLKLELTE